MELVLGFAWFFGSLYALVSLFRPLPPFNGRKQAALGLVAVQVAAVVAAIVIPRSDTTSAAKPQAPTASASTPDAKSDAPEGDPSYLVRIKPGEQRTVAPAAKAADVAALKVKTRAGLKTLDAAEVTLTSAVEQRRMDLVREAQNAALKVSFAMVTDREPLMGTADLESVLPCERAANTLATLARSVINDGQGVAAVQDRLRLQETYGVERKSCGVWIGS
ncbi:hypothetical protein [Phenylobacterium sp.]|uniref:hypothetical protein n=1 Tax=Phenylobacterium sp. TaxID=1871053 RepID=UPI002F41740D